MNQRNNEIQPLTHGIVHAGFVGFRAFVTRKISWCKLIGNRFEIPNVSYTQPLGAILKNDN